MAGFYDYPPPKHARYRLGRTTVVPQLRLKGKWLEQAGFTLDMPVRVIVRKGRLVVRGNGEKRKPRLRERPGLFRA